MRSPAVSTVLAVVTALVAAAPPARAQAPASLPFRIETVRSEAADGSPLHCLHYRPLAAPSGGVLLVHDWLGSGSGCWGTLPRDLAASGCEVLVPDLPGHGMGATGEVAQAVEARPTRADLERLEGLGAEWIARFSPAVTRVAIVCCGWSGLALPRWLPPAREAAGAVWIDPRGEAGEWEEALRAASQPLTRLLLVATREHTAGARAAENLYARLAPAAELRLFSRGEGGCALARERGVQVGLGEWVPALLSRGAAPGE